MLRGRGERESFTEEVDLSRDLEETGGANAFLVEGRPVQGLGLKEPLRFHCILQVGFQRGVVPHLVPGRCYVTQLGLDPAQLPFLCDYSQLSGESCSELLAQNLAVLTAGDARLSVLRDKGCLIPVASACLFIFFKHVDSLFK